MHMMIKSSYHQNMIFGHDETFIGFISKVFKKNYKYERNMNKYISSLFTEKMIF